MSTTNSIARRALMETFDPTCPNNAKFYACAKTSKSKFVGCCSIDPCELSTGCTTTQLQPVSFNASSYGTDSFPPDPDCGASDIFPYTCVQAPNTFWGCCKSNPCQNTPPSCKSGDLVPASLKTDMQFDAYTGSSNSDSSSDKGHVSTGIIAGATVGGVVAVAAIIAILIFFLCKKKRKNKDKESNPYSTTSPTAGDASTTPGGFADKTGFRGSTMTEGNPLPPTPSSHNGGGNQHHQHSSSERFGPKHSQKPTAPPLYTSPNPNDGSFHVSPQHGKGYDHHYQHVAQAPPMELSGESSLSAAEAAPRNFVAELPDNGSPAVASPGVGQAGKQPVELESPVATPVKPATPSKVVKPKFQESLDSRL